MPDGSETFILPTTKLLQRIKTKQYSVPNIVKDQTV